jgi:HK97 family phage major capsid protein
MSTTSQKVFFPVVTTKLAGGWVTETGSRPESQPVFDQLPIENFEHAVTVPISRQLLEDNFVDLAGYLASQIGTAFGKAESSAFVTGNGDGKPTGFMDDPDIYRFVEANMNGSDIVGKCIALHYHLEGAYAGRGSWLMNRRTQGLLRAAADNATKGLLWSDGLANGTPANFMGRPVYDVPDMENLYGEGSPPAIETFPIAFGDVASCYQILDRTAITLQRDDYTGADNGIVKFRAHRRVGGKVKQKEAMVVLKAVAQ